MRDVHLEVAKRYGEEISRVGQDLQHALLEKPMLLGTKMSCAYRAQSVG